MKKTIENYSKYESILFNILGFAFIANILTLAFFIVSDGNIPLWLMALVLPAAIISFSAFFLFIYLLVIFLKGKLSEDIKVWKTITGLLLSPLGLLFSFFNYMVIVLANIW